MSIFGKIKDAIFGKKAVAAQPAAPHSLDRFHKKQVAGSP